jgi:Mn2+/Fe2+ NRAMP family transporter
MTAPRRLSWLGIIGPGMIVAATGVGAGDLATGAFVGSTLGVTVLWAIILGAIFKWTVNEGLARWQLVTGGTLLEGVAAHFGRWAIWLFLAYLVLWTFFVASALMGACGAALHAIVPIWSASTDKIVFGIGQSLLTVTFLHLGGFRWFERFMSICVAVMFVVVVVSALAIGPDWPAVVRGLFVPRIPHAEGEGLSWTLALIGGIGGTVTVLSYGYWIREEGRTGPDDIRTCRLDLASGYAMTALFGMGMVIIGSTFLELKGDPNKGTTFVLDLAKQLEGRLGWAARWGFVIGAWCAVYSSMLGVWQSAPFLFADAWRLGNGDSTAALSSQAVSTRSRPYLWYQLALATIPAVSLWMSFVTMQKAYAVTGAFFVPILALVLLILNRRRSLLGQHRSGWLIQAILILALVLFTAAGIYEALSQLSS